MTDPKEKAEQLLVEAEHGRSERTPWLVLGGMQIVVLVIVAVVLALVFTVYLLA
jgi:disulfide bond formation protein DsbB